MSISLTYFLNKKQKTLKHFVEKNNLTDYQSLVECCKKRGFIPCLKEEYEKEIVRKKQIQEKEVKPVKRKTSKTRKKKKGGNNT